MKRTIGFVLILIAFFVPGMLALSPLPSLLEGRALRADVGQFATAECQALDASAVNHSSKYHSYFGPRIRCAYIVGGHRYVVDSQYLDLPTGYPTAATAQAAGEHLLSPTPPTVYYDPVDPSRAVLSRTIITDDSDWFIVGLGVLFLGLDALFLGLAARAGLRRLRARRVAREEFPSARVID